MFVCMSESLIKSFHLNDHIIICTLSNYSVPFIFFYSYVYYLPLVQIECKRKIEGCLMDDRYLNRDFNKGVQRLGANTLVTQGTATDFSH